MALVPVLFGAAVALGVRAIRNRRTRRIQEEEPVQEEDCPHISPTTPAQITTPSSASLEFLSRPEVSPATGPRQTSRQEFARTSLSETPTESPVSKESPALGRTSCPGRPSLLSSVPGSSRSSQKSSLSEHLASAASSSSHLTPPHTATDSSASSSHPEDQHSVESEVSDNEEPKSKMTELLEACILISQPPLHSNHFTKDTQQLLESMRPSWVQDSLSEIAARSWDGVEDITKEVLRLVSKTKQYDQADLSGCYRFMERKVSSC